jgi:hypothetical protein
MLLFFSKNGKMDIPTIFAGAWDKPSVSEQQ